MNFIDLIGKNFEHITLNPDNYSIELEDEEWMKEEGIAPSWTVTSNDGTFSMSLNQKKIIETIWLYPVDGKFELENYSTNTTQKEVRAKYGKPHASGEVEADILQEVSICWDRYDDQQKSLHFEYSAENLKLRLITLMDSKIVPQ